MLMQGAMDRLNVEKIVECKDLDIPPPPPWIHQAELNERNLDVLSLQDPESGSFAGDEWGETDTRFACCGVNCLALLGRLDQLDKDKTAGWLASCKNFDGGFGMVPGAESHAAQGELS